MQIKKLFLLFLLASFFLSSSFAQAARVEEQLLLEMPEISNQTPSREFYSIIHSAVAYRPQARQLLRINIISTSFLSSEYAKIVLHSYGFNNDQIDILSDAGSLKLNDRMYFIHNGVTISNQALINEPDEYSVKNSPSNGDHLAIIALGTGPLDETTPSLDMVKRVKTAIRILEKNPQAICIFSGGKTAGSISEARMMSLIALSRGVPVTKIYLEEESHSTEENARLTARLAETLPVTRFLLVTRPTHLKRALSIFKRYPEFRDLQAQPTDITEDEIVENLNNYLKFNHSNRVKYILNKVMKEYQDH